MYTPATLAIAIATYKGSEYKVEPYFNPSTECVNDVLRVTTDLYAFNSDIWKEDAVYLDKDKQTLSFKYTGMNGDVIVVTLPITDTVIEMCNTIVEKLSK